MEKRVLLALALSFLVLVLWQKFFAPVPPRRRQPAPPQAQQKKEKKNEAVRPEPRKEAPKKEAHPRAEALPAFPEKTLTLENEYLTLQLSSRGAGVTAATLRDYWRTAGAKRTRDPGQLLVLFDRTGQKDVPPAGALRLLGPDMPDLAKATWEVLHTANAREAAFARRVGDTRIEKRFRLPRGARHLLCEVTFKGPPLRYALAGPLGINAQADSGDALSAAVGSVTQSGQVHVEHYSVGRRDTSPPAERTRVVWAAVCRRYFAAILRAVGQNGSLLPGFVAEGRVEIAPEPEVAQRALAVFARLKQKNVSRLTEAEKKEALRKVPRTARVLLASKEGAGWPSAVHRYELYLGPKAPKAFAAYRECNYRGLIRYGSFLAPGFLVRLFLALLNGLRSVVFDYGIAICVLTFFVKLALHPLNRRNQKAMQQYQRKVQAIQPELDKIKERYKHNRQKMHREMQRLMQEHGVNPSQMLGGCLLMLLQLPIWVALIAVFRVSIDLRQAGAFFGLIEDLSLPDRTLSFGGSLPLLGRYLNILPILYIVLTLVQQKLSPKPKEEQARQQQRMMGFMMIFFGVIFYNFSSGLLLYFLTSAVLGIVEQQLIRRELEVEQQGKAPSKRKGH